MMEVYTAYADYNDLMNLTEELVCGLAREILGKTTIEYKGKSIDLEPPWERVSFADMMKELYDVSAEDDDDTWVAKLKTKRNQA